MGFVRRAALLMLLACDSPTAPASGPAAPSTVALARIDCAVDVRATAVACAAGTGVSSLASFAVIPGPDGAAATLLVGGQAVLVTLNSSAPAFAGDVFSFSTSVTNLIPQPLATTDGITPDPNGVRVFFPSNPTVAGGSGTVDFTDPAGGSLVDGFGTFTAPNQAYYKYAGILAPGETSAAKQWRFHISPGVTSFNFSVDINASVPSPGGFVDVTPTTSALRAGQTASLAAVVRDVVGNAIAGAPAVVWSSSAPAIAAVNASSGIVTAAADGAATITATSTIAGIVRTGSAAITVSTPSGATTTLTATPASLPVGGTANIVVQAKTASGADVTVGGDVVTLAADAGTLSTVKDEGNGTYTAQLTSASAHQAHVTGTIDGNAIVQSATVSFVAGTAARIVVAAGDAQSAVIGTPVAIAPSVRVIDDAGNPIAGTNVTFVVASGGGTIAGATPTTDANGAATLGSWTLGSAPGPNTLSATAAGLVATFTATATAGTPAAIVNAAGDAQSASAGAAVAIAPAVLVTDKAGNKLAGVAVTFTVVSGGGTVTGAAALTGPDGIASVGSWILGATAGPNSLGATAGRISTIFTATGVPTTVPIGPVTKLQLLLPGETAAPGTTTGKTGTPLTQSAGTPFTVIVNAVDANWNLVAATTTIVHFVSNDPLGAVLPADAQLIAGTRTFTAGATLKTATASATISASSASPVLSSATGTVTVAAGVVNHFVVQAAGGGSIGAQVAGTPFAITIIAQDANNNTATSFTSTVALTSTGALSGAPVTTAAFTNGVLASQSVTITNAGSFTLTATSATPSATGASASFTVGSAAATHFAITAVGGGAIAQQSAGTPFNVQITALDANNNTANFSGTATLTSTGTLTGAPVTTAAFTNGVLASQAITITNTGSFTLTAASIAPSATGTSAAFIVAGGNVTHFAVTAVGGGAIPTATAGTPFSNQITALDANNNTASFSGTVALTSTGTLTGAPITTASFIGGILASQTVTLTNTGSFTLTASSTTPSATGTSASFTVAAASATHIVVEAAGGGPISAQTAGTPFNVRLTALDANNNVATGFTGSAVLTSTGSLTGAPVTTAAFTNGVLASQSVTLTNTGSFTITATTASPATTGTSVAFTVIAGATTHFAIVATGGGAIAQQTAGTPFNIQITALDASNNTANFTGTVALTSTGTLTGAPVTTASFTAGMLAAQAVTITNTGSFTLTATSTTPAATGTSAAFTVGGGAATHFAITAVGGGAIPTATAATPFNVQITALDANNNTANFAGTATLTSTGALAGTPVATAAFTSGVLAAQSVAITNTGSFTLTATSTTPAATGTSAAFTVAPAAATHFLVEAAGGGAIAQQTAGTPFNIKLTALDANNNIATAFTSAAVLTSTGTLSGTPVTTAAFTSGVLASQAVTLTNSGSFTLTATSTTPSATGTSAAFTIIAGTVTHFAVTAIGGGAIAQQTAGTPFNVQITALDANGNTATGFTGTTALSSTGALTGAPITTAAFTNGVLASQAATITNTGSFTLTATSTTPAATGTSAAFTVGGGAATHFALAAVGGGAIPTATAGTSFNVQITALDANNNTANFTGTTVLTSTGTLTGAPITTGAFIGGVLASQAVTITNSGTFTITATSATPTATGTSAAFTVIAGGATHFLVEAAGGGAIAQQTAGTPLNIKLTALDVNDNIATSFTGTAVLSSTGTLSGAPVTTGSFTGGVLASQAVTITNSGSFTLTATSTTPAATGTSAAFTVVAGTVTHFAVTAIGGGAIAQQVAGTPFNIQVTALDAFGNTATGFTGTASLTANLGLVGAPVTTPAFTSGVLASQAVTMAIATSITITATSSTPSATGSSAAFTVIAGAVASIAKNAGDGQSGTAGSAVVTAPSVLVRRGGNPVSGVTVTFTVVSGGEQRHERTRRPRERQRHRNRRQLDARQHGRIELAHRLTLRRPIGDVHRRRRSRRGRACHRQRRKQSNRAGRDGRRHGATRIGYGFPFQSGPQRNGQLLHRAGRRRANRGNAVIRRERFGDGHQLDTRHVGHFKYAHCTVEFDQRHVHRDLNSGGGRRIRRHEYRGQRNRKSGREQRIQCEGRGAGCLYEYRDRL